MLAAAAAAAAAAETVAGAVVWRPTVSVRKNNVIREEKGAGERKRERERGIAGGREREKGREK